METVRSTMRSEWEVRPRGEGGQQYRMRVCGDDWHGRQAVCVLRQRQRMGMSECSSLVIDWGAAWNEQRLGHM